MVIVARPKHIYVRSAVLLTRVRTLPCMVTGVWGQTEPAHSNWGWGRGKSIKADDNRVAAISWPIHRELDQGLRWTESERKALWWKAHVKSVKALLAQDLWPQKVPIPDIEVYPW